MLSQGLPQGRHSSVGRATQTIYRKPGQGALSGALSPSTPGDTTLIKDRLRDRIPILPLALLALPWRRTASGLCPHPVPLPLSLFLPSSFRSRIVAAWPMQPSASGVPVKRWCL